MKDLIPDPKQKAILEAAWHAFASYGFRKTSMDDIARGAGMSRPALYLHYKGKEEIFRNLVQIYYEGAAADVETALEGAGDPVVLLTRAFEAQIGPSIEKLLASPHGMELWDAGYATAADVKAAGEARLVEIYGAWLQRDAAKGQLHLGATPKLVAETICAALRSLKTSATDYGALIVQVRLLAQILGDGLRPR